MKYFYYIFFCLFLFSCTSNTIYKQPKNLIPKDSMVALLTDMYIASSANGKKNKLLKREKNYTVLIYEKYKIDTTRFDISNKYYTSKIEEYTEILEKVSSNIDSLSNIIKKERAIYDSIHGGKKRIMNDSTIDPREMEYDDMPQILMEKNSKLLKGRKVNIQN
ncbi:DUF4296 domain-containing protein [Tenacibaculum ovolyticum]|uniref:DUF4296 domain-containing protein n=1 Tax=Tenacibaculum ovolyticum TaxID=104270 RepID=UPI00041911A8|nr:DUF4296 domain-containing protein [Tenacibaculum ovolyticum]WBX76908.1 DUF4296 domain-containing protein [Tenacibaculum ovolyticum]